MFDGRPLVRTGAYLYCDDVGHDACGIGGVAAREGTPSHEVIKKTVLGLVNVEHRGGLCGMAGDGAGLICQLPHSFFKEEARKLRLDQARYLKPEDTLAVGVFFLGGDEATRDQAKLTIREVLANGPVHWLGWRPVPTRDDVLPDLARRTRPQIEQLLLRVDGDPATTELWLYRARLELRHRFRQAGLDVYIPTLSARVVGYKGLLTAPQFAEFYPDLADPSFETGLALFHRRYSTNTYPNWTLAQPFRLSCHNGEINTIRTTRNAVHAYARGLEPPLPGRDLLTPAASDSQSLDEWVEHLVHVKGWSLLRALRLSVPPVWDSEADYLGPGGGRPVHLRPAGVRRPRRVGRPGRRGRDRRPGARRPGRPHGPAAGAVVRDDRGWLYIGSESGVYGLDSTKIVASGQLQPGQMIAHDTATGERLDSHQILARIVEEARGDLGDVHELNRQQIIVPSRSTTTRRWTRRSAANWRPTAGRSSTCCRPTAGTSSGPSSSRRWPSSRRSRSRRWASTVCSRSFPPTTRRCSNTCSRRLPR